jgi:hypothetical protein
MATRKTSHRDGQIVDVTFNGLWRRVARVSANLRDVNGGLVGLWRDTRTHGGDAFLGLFGGGGDA